MASQRAGGSQSCVAGARQAGMFVNLTDKTDTFSSSCLRNPISHDYVHISRQDMSYNVQTSTD